MTIEQMIARQQQLVDAARAEHRDLNAEESAEYEKLQRQIADARQAAGSAHANPAPASTSTEGGGQRSASQTANPDPEAETRAAQAERERVLHIQSLCRQFDMDPAEFINNGSTEDQVRAAVIDRLTRQSAPVASHITQVDDENDRFRRMASDSLVMRSGMTLDHPEEGARSLTGMSLRDLAIECLQRDGYQDGSLLRKGPEEIYDIVAKRAFYNPESAFPAILDQTIEKAYKEGYNKAPVTFDRFTKKGSLRDFKKHDNYYLAGPVGEFLEVPENGELKHDVFDDAHLPQRQLKTYGRQFTLSRKAFIDDDIGLVTSIPARYAASARKTINKQVYEILVNNNTIYDGAKLFGTEHKNMLATGTGITQEAMQTMIMALSNQKDQFGEAIIIRPATIVVPSGMKFDMYTLFFSPTINTSDNTQAVNPLYEYRDSIQVVEDPTINVLCGGFGNVMPWFLFGDQSDTDGIEVDYLNGQEIPNIRRMETPGTLGFVWDIYLDWGISVMDYRGIVKNPGVKVDTKLKLA